jgi:hypothetical protein
MPSHTALPSISRSVGAGFLLILLSVIFTALFSAIAGVVCGTLLSIFMDIKRNLTVFKLMADVITLLAPLPALHYALRAVVKIVKRFRGNILYGMFMFYTVQSMIGAWYIPDDMMIFGMNISDMPNLALKQTIVGLLTLGVFHHWVFIEKRYGEW